jgi:hypothetical protein
MSDAKIWRDFQFLWAAAGHWLPASGCWLLAAGYLPLAAGTPINRHLDDSIHQRPAARSEKPGANNFDTCNTQLATRNTE